MSRISEYATQCRCASSAANHFLQCICLIAERAFSICFYLLYLHIILCSEFSPFLSTANTHLRNYRTNRIERHLPTICRRTTQTRTAHTHSPHHTRKTNECMSLRLNSRTNIIVTHSKTTNHFNIYKLKFEMLNPSVIHSFIHLLFATEHLRYTPLWPPLNLFWMYFTLPNPRPPEKSSFRFLSPVICIYP